MDLVVYDDDDQRYVPWLVTLAAVVLAGLLAALATFLLVREPASAAISGVSGPEAATASSPPAAAAEQTPAACTDALAQADAALEQGDAIGKALAEQTRVMDELLANRVTTPQALDQALPALTQGATDRLQFAEQREAYERARKACQD